MSTISNKFMVQVIEDGTTLHGELRATKSLTQSLIKGNCVPDWSSSHPENRPLVYVSLMNGTTATTPDANTDKWYYNGTLVTWASTTSQQTIGGTAYTGYVSTNFGGRFFKTTHTVGGVTMPAFGIIGNVADLSDVVDVDVIRYEGQKTLSTNPVDFAASIYVTISEYTDGGYQGIINFRNGIADITRDNSSVTCEATLFGDSGSAVTGATYKWYFEGDPTIKSSTSTLTVNEDDVTDYVIVRCQFYVVMEGATEPEKIFEARVGIDDRTDPEIMWVRYNGGQGNMASLRKGEDVTFTIFVGDGNQSVDTRWNTFKLMTLASDGSLVTEAFANITAAGSDGYRTLTVSNHAATAQITYDDVVGKCKKGLTGIIVAYT